VKKFLRCGLRFSVWFFGVVSVSGCGLGSVFAGFACACMLFSVRMYVGWRALGMLLVHGGLV